MKTTSQLRTIMTLEQTCSAGRQESTALNYHFAVIVVPQFNAENDIEEQKQIGTARTKYAASFIL
jgi:hypothetical protein